MHEFSLAKNIVEIAEKALRNNNLTFISKIELDIGQLSGVELQALQTALECLRMGNVIDKAEIIFNIIEARAVCRACHHEYQLNDFYTPCPVCNSFGPQIISGKDLIVKSIVAE
jgi:hydrogenase nickel incorporation protein HypA/HybF